MPRKTQNRQIFDKASLTNQLVSITVAMKEDPTDALPQLIALTISQLLNDCAYYIPSSFNSPLCGSGEANGKMFVANACCKCIVGQFSQYGKFVGEIQEEDSIDELEVSSSFDV